MPALTAAQIALLLAQILVILGLCRLLGAVFVKLRLPRVLGEMLAGLVLGASLLAWLAPGTHKLLFPEAGGPYLKLASSLAKVLFLFLLGMEISSDLVKRDRRASVMTSLGGLALCLVASLLASNTFTLGSVSPAFLGLVLGVTSLPLVLRVIAEGNQRETRLGVIGVGASAHTEVIVWFAAPLLVAIHAAPGPWLGLRTVLFAASYVLVMVLVVRPMMVRLEKVYGHQHRLSQNLVSLIVLLAIASAAVGQWAGFSDLLGAFLTGLVIPAGTGFARLLREKLEDFSAILLLPIFFAYIGQQTDFASAPASLWLVGTLVVVVAFAFKGVGVALGAYTNGVPPRDSLALGSLMNARGLAALILLDLGRENQLLSPGLFAVLVAGVFITTLAATPLYRYLLPRAQKESCPAVTLERGRFAIVMPVSLPTTGPALVGVAKSIIGDGPESGSVVGVHFRPPPDRSIPGTRDESQQIGGDILSPLLAEAQRLKLVAGGFVRTSVDVAQDVSCVARERTADLVLIGFHQPVIGQAVLGGTVHKILEQCPCDVGILFDRRPGTKKSIMIPYVGGVHDDLALDLARRMANHDGARLTMLRVLPPDSSDALAGASNEGIVGVINSTIKVVRDASPVDAVIREAPGFDLLIIGVAAQWELQSQVFGFRAQRIVRDCPGSILMVRSHLVQTAPAPSGPVNL